MHDCWYATERKTQSTERCCQNSSCSFMDIDCWHFQYLRHVIIMWHWNSDCCWLLNTLWAQLWLCDVTCDLCSCSAVLTLHTAHLSVGVPSSLCAILLELNRFIARLVHNGISHTVVKYLAIIADMHLHQFCAKVLYTCYKYMCYNHFNCCGQCPPCVHAELQCEYARKLIKVNTGIFRWWRYWNERNIARERSHMLC